MKTSPVHFATALFAGASIALTACGGGGGGSTSRAPGGTTTAPPVASAFDRNRATALGTASAARRASNEPTSKNDDQNFGYIGGVDPNPLLAHITRGCTQQSCYPASLSARHGDAEIGHIRLRDGVSANELLRYLRADANHSNGLVWRWGATPPVVRMFEGSSDRDMFETEMAVRMINSALPANWQLRFDSTLVPPDGRLNPGYIEVGFVPRERWPGTPSANAVGVAYHDGTNGEMTAAVTLVDPTRVTDTRERVAVLLHELLHALGRGHVSPAAFRDTIMHPSIDDGGVSDWLILNYLDEAALHAVYSRFPVGTAESDLSYRSLGPWSDVSTHVYGRIGYIPGRFEAVIFGAVWQNGNVRPYALALDPSPPLADGRRTGNATWSGRLAGLTPQAEAVAGAADMTVQLATLRGALDFTGLEHWAAHAAPGAIGTGTQWGDGDLNYRIAVNGPVFYETGGDAGRVTGAFFGPNRNKMGGTLRRTDLAAGFGAQRQ
ncbi:MAG: hypothetical protein OXP66_17730 [Candidatus Tectomicrobia bacterium]|nr:hypothetical protein [Candidatus Tectomicrobia bacterium]